MGETFQWLSSGDVGQFQAMRYRPSAVGPQRFQAPVSMDVIVPISISFAGAIAPLAPGGTAPPPAPRNIFFSMDTRRSQLDRALAYLRDLSSRFRTPASRYDFALTTSGSVRGGVGPYVPTLLWNGKLSLAEYQNVMRMLVSGFTYPGLPLAGSPPADAAAAERRDVGQQFQGPRWSARPYAVGPQRFQAPVRAAPPRCQVLLVRENPAQRISEWVTCSFDCGQLTAVLQSFGYVYQQLARFAPMGQALDLTRLPRNVQDQLLARCDSIVQRFSGSMQSQTLRGATSFEWLGRPQSGTLGWMNFPCWGPPLGNNPDVARFSTCHDQQLDAAQRFCDPNRGGSWTPYPSQRACELDQRDIRIDQNCLQYCKGGVVQGAEGPCTSDANIKRAQAKVGVTADGIWGPGTQCAVDQYGLGRLQGEVNCDGEFPVYEFHTPRTGPEELACAGEDPCPGPARFNRATGLCGDAQPSTDCRQNPGRCNPAEQSCDQATGDCFNDCRKQPFCGEGQICDEATGNCTTPPPPPPPTSSGRRSSGGAAGIILLAVAALAGIGAAIAGRGGA